MNDRKTRQRTRDFWFVICVLMAFVMCAVGLSLPYCVRYSWTWILGVGVVYGSAIVQLFGFVCLLRIAPWKYPNSDRPESDS